MSDKAQNEAKISRRNTRSKALILDFLKKVGDNHTTAEEIVDGLKAEGTPVSKSTVYRFLSQLEADGSVRKYIVGENASACYSLVNDDGHCREHFHLMCRDCGSVVHFENNSLKRVIEELDDKNGFLIDIGDSPFYGMCQNCKRNKNRK